ncbi:hypothetical protein MSHO_53220 [Mycobacterium shottsii]|uniref:Uncharacterized protein n=1 Tax=Mycobacterium shottsii TaxID=133549 RepID=A0A7I7LK81_9MYCO|nr:hypothetical protein MSHO_53220 [Mycobacterium shottsii]
MLHVSHQCRCPGDVDRDPGRRLGAVNDAADSFDGFVAQRLTLVAGQIQLDISGLVIGTLRPGSGKRIPPEILDVLHVPGIATQPTDQIVVVLVGVGAEGLVAFQNNCHDAVGIRFLEHRPDPVYSLHRRRVAGSQ